MDKAKGDQKIAVYDLGGGTFDISIIEIAEVEGEHQFEVLSTNGDTFLGGEDFDLRLIEYLARSSRRSRESTCTTTRWPCSASRRPPKGQDRAVQLQQTEVNLPYITADATGPEAPQRQADPGQAGVAGRGPGRAHHGAVKHGLKDAGLSPSEIDEVILVGGQTRMPKVQQKVEDFFGKEPAQGRQPGRGRGHRRAIQGGVLAATSRTCCCWT
jgi:molecular chaperone DnaK